MAHIHIHFLCILDIYIVYVCVVHVCRWRVMVFKCTALHLNANLWIASICVWYEILFMNTLNANDSANFMGFVLYRNSFG